MRGLQNTVLPFMAGMVSGLMLVGLALFPLRAQQATNIFVENTPFVYNCRESTILERRNCNDTNLVLFFMVMSTPDYKGAEARLLGRKSVFKNTPYFEELRTEIIVRFVLATNGISQAQRNNLTDEQDTFKDLILLKDHEDTYYELTRKVQLSLQWAAKYMNFDYLIKTDDDVVILIRNMIVALKEMNCPKKLFWGHFYYKKKIETKGKWTEKQWNLCEEFLPYPAGTAYVLERQLVNSIARYGQHLKSYYTSEDATMGLWVAPFKVETMHDERVRLLVTCSTRNIIAIHHARLFKKTARIMMKSGKICE